MNRNKILKFFAIVLVLVLVSLFLVMSHMITIPGVNEEKIATSFLSLFNISAGDEKYTFGENATRENIINKGYEIMEINDTFIEETPALKRAFEDGHIAMIYSEDRNSTAVLNGKVLEYNGSLYYTLIGCA
ncbi:hypothetical protein J2128_001515 [Methanomicrobium sp. W14]|uniref:hypothetical protein n=1 Tax=Methanomicrobium sp. W14 TaxID=2817839 RepID=UPI001AE39937|nr:hypothetical protein [Methanomicrobium sp. W14]MBP2133561.1 hypothetical protein [Methanomicrobium sp. W14]